MTDPCKSCGALKCVAFDACQCCGKCRNCGQAHGLVGPEVVPRWVPPYIDPFPQPFLPDWTGPFWEVSPQTITGDRIVVSDPYATTGCATS